MTDYENKTDREIIVELHTNQTWIMETLKNHLAHHEKVSLQNRWMRVFVIVAAVSAVISVIFGVLQFIY